VKKVHVKWIGPNDPMIRVARNDARLYLTKRELLDLRNEITEFLKYYPDDFSAGRIDDETPPEDISVWAIDYDKKVTG
jgi:hypothetical protein